MRCVIPFLILSSLAGCAQRDPVPVERPNLAKAEARPITRDEIDGIHREIDGLWNENKTLWQSVHALQDAPKVQPAADPRIGELMVRMDAFTAKLDTLRLDVLDAHTKLSPLLKPVVKDIPKVEAKPPPGPPLRELLVFDATWCGPCKRQKIDALTPLRSGQGINPEILNDPTRTKPVVMIVEVDFDQRKDLVEKYGVTSLPTSVGLVDGKEHGRLTGAATKPEQLAALVGVAK